MQPWHLRGLVMALLQIVVRILLGFGIIAWPVQSPILRAIAIAVVVIAAIVWGGYDGIRDARAHPDPDDYADLTMRWLKAGLAAGFISCLVCWILGTFWINGLGQADFWVEMTAGLSFITLLVYVPAFFGVSVGRYLVRRDQRKGEDTDWSHREQSDADAPTQVVQVG
ncbi:hypothetical protein GOHSU_18_00930 [Gordonia hirsuta DSM 44140 = NBRC 16056]|uniref:Transmembrane protein n=1 Tax=Gordonia hirsuta DSM 44140 = NBRC 16056 TaxID=1121927 RepID=L7LBB8_9ACTN|nr:B-4DMT family transporter [Gordonia hirsuta]GAC57338.1 hypothetical protein GOHSU_18_00930 [Gordonia hirsuta DSM 44140 = NBRC 16056]